MVAKKRGYPNMFRQKTPGDYGFGECVSALRPYGKVIQTRGAGNDLASFFMWSNRCNNCARMVKKWWGVPNIFDAGVKAA